jgi:PAS domain S-box-containing protein
MDIPIMNQVTNKLLSNTSLEELRARHNQLRRAYMDLHATNQKLKANENLLIERLLEKEANERKYISIIENSDSALFVCRPNGAIIEVNAAACRIFGYTESEFKKMHRSDILDINDPEVIHMLHERQKNGIVNGEINVTNKKRETVRVSVSSFVFKDSFYEEDRVSTVMLDISSRKKEEDELKEKNKQLKELSRYLQQAREEERKQFAREVHDELGQLAAVVKMDIDWLTIKLPELGEAYNSRVMHASSTASLLITAIRKLASELRPGMLDELGLNACLEWKCKNFTANKEIPCLFSSAILDHDLSPQIKTELFRICQEALNNVAKHANASSVTVAISEENDQIHLCITDNGKGFDAEQKINHTHGLISMRERSISINGTLVINSEPGKGTVVCAIIPKKEDI